MSERAEPVGGPVLTRSTRVLLAIVVVAFVIMVWRFAVGLGPSTGLSDGYPWGIWIAFDVVTGTALACGGYAVAILVYILNRGKFHPLVRPAVLTSALGYSLAGLAIVVDVGRPWLIWRIPLSPDKWNLNSALLEVALCVMAYTVVLWLEMAPAFLEKWKSSTGLRLKLARTFTPVLDRALIWILALGLLLPTMHQSSLGTVMLLSGHKLHRLWHTPLIPLLFLISCVAMGYAVVVAESHFSTRVFGRKPETKMLASLGRVMAWVAVAWVLIRAIDLVARGRIGLPFTEGLLSVMFWIEMLLAIVPAVLLFDARRRARSKVQVQAAMLLVLCGILYRFDAYLVGFDPGPGWSYFPTAPEIMITIGIVAVEVLAYVLIVKLFPIIAGARTAPAHR